MIDDAPSTTYLIQEEEVFSSRLARLESAYRCADSDPTAPVTLLESLLGGIEYCETRLADIHAVLATRGRHN